MKKLTDRAVSWTSPNETGDELSEIHRRAAETMGYSMEKDCFDARQEYEQRFPGNRGPEEHLRQLIKQSERSCDEAIALGRKGGGK